MKTPMQKAIDKVSFVRNMCNDENNEMTIKHVLETLKEDLSELLKEEKEQIILSAAKGYLVGEDEYFPKLAALKYGEDYYNEKYNQKQHIIDIMKADEQDGLYNEKTK